MKKIIVLSSGGLDSTTCLSIALEKDAKIYPLTFVYGQKHKKEVEQIKLIRKELGISKENHIIINLNSIGGSALIDEDMNISQEDNQSIPNTYVPGRNIIFLSYATSIAEKIGSTEIYIGVSSIDYSGYPDCRPEFIKKFQELIDIGTKSGV